MKIQKLTRWLTVMLMFVLVMSAIIPSPVVHASPITTKPAAMASATAFDCSLVSGIPQAECQALVALYQGTNGSGWTNSTGWLANTTPCTWYGVTCTSDHITTINLYSNLLKGSLPPEISGLTGLTSLILATNQLSGSIPAQLGSLAKLEVLYLAFNQFSGPLPAELGKLANLQNLQVRDNQFSGALPVELGSLVNLHYADFTNNQFSGDIPAGFATITALTDLRLSGNKFNIPGEPLLSQLLYKSPNDPHWPANQGSTTPPPPASFECSTVTAVSPAECRALVALYNSTTGHAWTNSTGWLAAPSPCTWFGVTCTNGHVTTLSLYSNALAGPLPAEIGDLSYLTSLILATNQLSGPIPPELGKLTDLQVIYLARNALTGSIPPELGSLTNLTYLILFENQLSGPLPAELSKMTHLQNLTVRSNQLSGSIPVEIGSMPSLKYVEFNNNQFCGQIPAGLGTMASLVDLKLSGNHFTIPGEPLLSQLYAKTPNDQNWTANQTAGECGGGSTSTLLALYVLAFDNNPDSPTNLTPYFSNTMASIASATAGRPGVEAVVLSDLSGPDNVAAYEIDNGVVSQLTFPWGTSGYPALTESTVVNGPELGAFLQWARVTYPAQRTILSYQGHNKPLPAEGLAGTAAPATSAATADSGLFPLPIHDGAHPDYTDNTPLPEVLSIYDLGEALRLASQDGTQPLDLVDLSSCFAMSFEETYALRHYTRTITGSPNYDFFEPALAGDFLLAVNASMTARQMAAYVIYAYDKALPADGHPRILTALDTTTLDSIKEAWDSVSYNLYQGLNSPDQRQDTKNKMVKAYQYSHKYDCTFCQPQDWALETPDALVDLGSFAAMLRYQFGELSPVGIAAGDTIGYLNQAVIARFSHNGIPWFGNPAKSWDFTGNSGLSLYADLVGQNDGQGHIILSDIAPWYTRVQSAENPHPYEFVLNGAYGKEIQSTGINWSDTFISFWQGATNLLTKLCLPTFPPITESGDIAAGIVLSPISGQARVGTPTTLSATVSTTEDVHNLQVSIKVYQNGAFVFDNTVVVPELLAGTTAAVTASQTWTPTVSGSYVLRFFFDSNNNVQETNEKNNLLYSTGTVREAPTCPRPEISAGIANPQQWWPGGPIPLAVSQTHATATEDAALVNRLVVEFYQYQPGVNPTIQVPVRMGQQIISPISLPQTSLALSLPANLQPGVVVMHIWPRSDCGGLGYPRELTFNYVPANASLSQNRHQFFTFQVGAGEQVALSLAVSSGSANMYVWMPGNSWSAQSITGSGTITINPTEAGTYVVEVNATAPDTVYTLTATRNTSEILGAQSALGSVSAVVTVSRSKPDFSQPVFTLPGEFILFLPVLVR